MANHVVIENLAVDPWGELAHPHPALLVPLLEQLRCVAFRNQLQAQQEPQLVF
jgi:hypothetical protein